VTPGYDCVVLIWLCSLAGDLDISELNLVDYPRHLSIIVWHSQAGRALAAVKYEISFWRVASAVVSGEAEQVAEGVGE